MWESRRDFQRVWEGWEAGFMAFHAFHTLSFPWPPCRKANAENTDMPPPSAMCRTRQEMLICTDRLSLSALAIWRETRTLPATCAFSGRCPVPRWVRPGKPDIEKPR
jgi:hypothetical protein